MSAATQASGPARIGPNAITRVAQALTESVGPDGARDVFTRASLAPYLSAPPEAMVPEDEVARLHAALAETPGLHGPAIARRAGTLTADYLLAHRLPKPVQALLRALPARWAAHALIMAIRRNAWTFCGSASFVGAGGRPTRVTIAGGLLAGAGAAEVSAAFHAAVFERLFQALVTPQARANERLADDTLIIVIDWA
jgi:divinyl protochlorophyllide a 8-vinyl-reductase